MKHARLFLHSATLCLFTHTSFAAEGQPKLIAPTPPQLNVAGAMVLTGTIPVGYRLVYEQKFDGAAALQDFRFTDPAAWRFAQTNDTAALELVKQSQYKPIVRSPVNIALIADKLFGDFVLEADLIQTGKEYGHRDMCLFFGFQSPTNFYYTHIATAADPNAHNVFIVNGAPRKNFASRRWQSASAFTCRWLRRSQSGWVRYCLSGTAGAHPGRQTRIVLSGSGPS